MSIYTPWKIQSHVFWNDNKSLLQYFLPFSTNFLLYFSLDMLISLKRFFQSLDSIYRGVLHDIHYNGITELQQNAPWHLRSVQAIFMRDELTASDVVWTWLIVPVSRYCSANWNINWQTILIQFSITFSCLKPLLQIFEHIHSIPKLHNC